MGASYQAGRGRQRIRHPWRVIRGYFRNAGILAASEIIAKLKGFVLVPLLTRYFGTLNYGVWSQVAVLTGLVPPLIILGTDVAVVRFLPGRSLNDQRREFTAWVIGVGGAAVLLCSLVALLAEPISVVFFGSGHQYADLIRIGALYIFVTVAIAALRGWVRVQNDAKAYAAITLGQAASGLVMTIVFLLLAAGVKTLVVLSIAGDALVVLAVGTVVVRRHGFARPDFSVLPGWLRFSLPVLPAGYAVWALNWLDRIFLVQYSTLSDIGIYSLAYTLGYLLIQVAVNPIWTMFPNNAASLWNQGRRDEVQGLFDRTAGTVIVIVFPAIVGAAVAGGSLIRVLATPAFAEAAPVIPIVLGGYLMFMLAAWYETQFGLVHKQYLSTVSVVIAFAVNLALNFVLIPPYSFLGAAIATAAAFAVQLVFAVGVGTYLGLVETKLKLPLQALLASLAMGVAVYPIHKAVGEGGLGLLVTTVSGVAIYATLVMALGIVPPEVVRREGKRMLDRLRRTQPTAAAVGGPVEQGDA
jgi:O-antigen/teichoic acid export membrane protein